MTSDGGWSLDPSARLAKGTVLDFWRWALGDLKMNTARGYLAEYLVARAVDSKSPHRVEWDAWDVTAGDGTKIEVKATGRLQSWTQKRVTTPRWTFPSVNSTEEWSDADGAYRPVDPADRVDVWVFALQTCTDDAAYDPLSTDQWEFRVIPHRELLAAGQKSAGLPFFEHRGVLPVGYDQLKEAVSAARQANEQHDR